jgi:hypothetical protein
MPDTDSSRFEWEGTADPRDFTGALLEIAQLAFTSAAQLKAGKNALTSREVAECVQQTVTWGSPDGLLRIRESFKLGPRGAAYAHIARGVTSRTQHPPSRSHQPGGGGEQQLRAPTALGAHSTEWV